MPGRWSTSSTFAASRRSFRIWWPARSSATGPSSSRCASGSHTAEKFARGVVFFALGMAKKILIANPLAQVADTAFDAGGLHWYDAWYGVVGYAFQIYFDFSGYSDMASGLALMMGFVLDPELRLALPGREHHRLLAAVAHQPLDLAARLPVHPARRQPPRQGSHLRQSHARHADRRLVARGELELRHLGRDPRRHAGFRAHAGQAGPVRAACAGPCASVSDFRHRLHHLGLLPRRDTAAGDRPISPASSAWDRRPLASDAVAASMYTNYHLLIFIIAGFLVWHSPTSWVFSRRITWARAAYAGFAAGALRGLHVDAERKPIHLLPVLRRGMSIAHRAKKKRRSAPRRLGPGPGGTSREVVRGRPEPRHPDDRDRPRPGQGDDRSFSWR